MSPKTEDRDILIVSGSSDKTVKLWNLELDDSEGVQKLQLALYSELEPTDQVLSVKFSPDGSFLCFSLLDNTLKINYCDSMNLFLSLYGHKLPILDFDISSDTTMIATASADKNVKLWGMDFGDCHKSIFCHDNSITCVKFVKDTHYFWTASKDCTIKYFDGDTYNEIQSFEQPNGFVWALGVSRIGDYIYSVCGDSSIRVIRQTKEQLFLSQEKEEKLEKLMIEEGEFDALDHYANE